MTLPKSDAQSSRLLPRRQHMVSFTHSKAPPPLATPFPGSVVPSTELPDKTAHEHALDFATHSWDLATGGLKTLTAKRQLPPRIERRGMEAMPDSIPPRSYALTLAILVSIVLMLIGGGVILFVMLQP